MGLTANVVSNTPITSAWGNEIRDRANQVFATLAERSSQWPSPPMGAESWVTATASQYVWNGTAWVCVTPQVAAVATSQTTTSATYTDLATVGPTLSLLTGARVLCTVGGYVTNATAGDGGAIGVAVTGASSVVANDGGSFYVQNVTAGQAYRGSFQFLFTALTPGTNTFTAKYKQIAGGTATFSDRYLTVVGLP